MQQSLNFKPKEGFDIFANDLLMKLLRLDAEERITVKGAIGHPF